MVNIDDIGAVTAVEVFSAFIQLIDYILEIPKEFDIPVLCMNNKLLVYGFDINDVMQFDIVVAVSGPDFDYGIFIMLLIVQVIGIVLVY